MAIWPTCKEGCDYRCTHLEEQIACVLLKFVSIYHTLSLHANFIFFRCISIAAYACQNYAVETRVRILFELVTNIYDYLNNEYLNRGLLQFDKYVLSKFLTYSSDNPSRTGYDVQMQEIIMSSVKDGRYCTVFHVMAAASVLQRKIILVYPIYGGATIHNDLNRVFFPRGEAPADQAFYIMFTSTQGILQEERCFRVNHFCVLLPASTAVFR